MAWKNHPSNSFTTVSLTLSLVACLAVGAASSIGLTASSGPDPANENGASPQMDRGASVSPYVTPEDITGIVADPISWDRFVSGLPDSLQEKAEALRTQAEILAGSNAMACEFPVEIIFFDGSMSDFGLAGITGFFCDSELHFWEGPYVWNPTNVCDPLRDICHYIFVGVCPGLPQSCLGGAEGNDAYHDLAADARDFATAYGAYVGASTSPSMGSPAWGAG